MGRATLVLAMSLLVVTAAQMAVADARPTIHFTAHERSACRSESFRFCAYTYPSKRDLVGCLQSHQSSLGNACSRALYRGVSERPSLSH